MSNSNIDYGEYRSNKYMDIDYSTLFESIKKHFQSDPSSPFKDYNFDGSNLNQLIKILAYVTHMSLFHTSLALNEQFLSTARKRSSIVKQLPAYGYAQRRNTASSKYLTIRNSTEYDYVLEEFTEFNATGNEASDDKKFYNIDSYTIPANGYIVIRVYQSSSSGGYTIRNLDISGDNDILTEIKIDIPQLSQQYFKVQTIENGDIVSWIQYETLDSLQNELDNIELTLLPQSNIFFLDETDTGYVIKFSTTGIGSKPNPDDGKTLTIKYTECDGSASNGFSTSMFSLASPIDGIEILQDTDILASSSIGISSGGLDKETIDELRENVIASFNTQNRAVTEYDYTKIGQVHDLIGPDGNIQVYGGEKHICAKRLGKVFIVAAPPNNGQYFFTTSEKSEIESYFKKFNITGITPIVQNPHYINAITEYDFIFKSLISDTDVIADELKVIIRDFFRSNFGETIYIPQLVEEINRVFGVESAFIKTRFKIVFDRLSDLTGTYKIIPADQSDVSQFIGTSGEIYSGYVFGFTDDPLYIGENYGRIVSVNEDSGYLIVEQSSGVNNNNFERFSKGISSNSYLPRKDIISINYSEISGSNDLFVSNTNGLDIDNDIVSLVGGSSITTGSISEIDKSSSGRKYCNINLDTTILGGTYSIRVNDNLVNVNSIVGSVKSVTGTTSVILYYVNGSDFQDGQDLDFGTSYVSGKINIAKRQTLYVPNIINGSSSGGTGVISFGEKLIDMYNILGTVESSGTCASSGSSFISLWYSDSNSYQSPPFILEVGTSWSGGSTTGKFTISVTGSEIIENGVGQPSYRVRVVDVTASGWQIGTSNLEPGDTWKFNRISSIGASTNVITVEDPLRGIVTGDSICNSGNSLVTIVLGITGNVLTLENGTGFNEGLLIHPGYIWSGVQYSNLVRFIPVYDEEDVSSVVIDTPFYIGSSSFMRQTSGIAQVNLVGTSTIDPSGTSNVMVYVSNSTGYFYIGENNTLFVQTQDTPFEPLYTLTGNIEDFNTDYIIQYDIEDGLKYFVNKLDDTDDGMIDASPEEKPSVGYSMMFNTTGNLDRDGLSVSIAYGTSNIIDLETSMNKKYSATIKVDGPIGGTSGAVVTQLALSDRLTIKSGTSVLIGIVSGISVVNSAYSIELAYDSSTFYFTAGTQNCIAYGDMGLGWDGSSATNYIVSVISERQQPNRIIFYSSGTSLNTNGSSFGYVDINISTGDVAVRRAENVSSSLINSGTSGFRSVDSASRKLYFTDSSIFPECGGTTSYIVNIWNTSTYEWDVWEYTENSISSNPQYLYSVNDIPEGIDEDMLVVFDKESPLRRIEMGFKNKVDRLKLGNRALFYSSKDLVIPIV